MGSNYPFMPFYVSDFNIDTQHLTWQAKAAYRALLDAYWLRGRGLNDDDDELALIIGMTRREWDVVRDKVLPFFTLSDGNVLTQKRIEAEIQEAKDRSQAQRDRVNKRWGAHTEVLQAYPSGNSTVIQSTSTSTSTVTEEELNTVDAVASTPRKTFQKPTLEEVRGYCSERGKGVDPEAWFDHYTSNGWRVGKNPMKSWKAAVRTWERTGFGVAEPVEMTDAQRMERIAEIRRGVR